MLFQYKYMHRYRFVLMCVQSEHSLLHVYVCMALAHIPFAVILGGGQ